MIKMDEKNLKKIFDFFDPNLLSKICIVVYFIEFLCYSMIIKNFLVIKYFNDFLDLKIRIELICIKLHFYT